MDDGEPARRPTRLVLAAVGLFLLAVLLGRLLIAGGAAWIAFAVILPILLFVGSAAANFRIALITTVAFAALVLAMKWFLQQSSTGWVALLLLPVVAFTALLVGKVLGVMRRDRRAAREEPGPEAKP